MRRKILIVIPLVLLVLVVGFIIWGSTPLGPSSTAISATSSGQGLVVENTNGWLAFWPENKQTTTGFIFYPGGRVEYRSYAPVLRLIAAQGYLVVLPPMPLNLAVFGIEKASDVILAYPQIKNWAIGGHSLGGSMAAQFVANHPGFIKGLVFWASYPPLSMANRADLAIVTIYGTNDGLAGPEKINDSRKDLPPQTIYVPIQGGNHAQFGSYGDQPGDNQAVIPPNSQWQQAADSTIKLLKGIGGLNP